MPYPYWNKNEAANVVCWLCEHFQRRDSTPGTQNCQGECRKEPIDFGGLLRNDTQDSNGDLNGAFAFVPFGNTTWCSGFQMSLEDNIPDVVSGRNNCSDQSVSDWLSPRDNMTNNAPRENKRPMDETCWYCEHFQRSPEVQGSGTPCTGFCQINPPKPFLHENSDWTGGGNNRMEYWYSEQYMQNAAWFWCSKWKRSRLEVPDPPEFGGVVCAGGA